MSFKIVGPPTTDFQFVAPKIRTGFETKTTLPRDLQNDEHIHQHSGLGHLF